MRPSDGSVKPAPFDYVRPGIARRSRRGPGRRSGREGAGRRPEPGPAAVDAAGRTVAARRHQRRCPASTAIDADDDGVRIGALARHADVLASADVRRVQPLVSLALANVAHATIRNRGTTVGSIVHADAAAEMPVVLRLLGGSRRRRRARRAGARSRPTTCSSGPLESLAAPRRDRGVGVLPGAAPPAPAWPSRRSPAGTATTRWCGVAALVDGDDGRRSATSRWATCRPWST